MKDRYLFRGKRIDGEGWVEGQYVVAAVDMSGIKQQIIFVPDNDFGYHWYVVDPSTICQCSGLKDDNGKLIWENDIVKMRCNGLSGYGTVIYINGCYWIDDKKRGRQYPFSNHDVKYRVDGNVFDNPELLEAQG